MTSKEKDSLKDIFMALDKNGDGTLTQDELVEGYTKMYGSKDIAMAEVTYLMNIADVDNNGVIDYSGIKILNNIVQSFYWLLLTKGNCCQKRILNKLLICLIL